MGVGAGVAVDVGEGEGVDTDEIVDVGVGDGVGVLLDVGVGDEETTGVGDGVGVGDEVGVGTYVAVPEPGQVWDKRIPESIVLMVAKEPACTIRSLSLVNVYTYAPFPNWTSAPDLMTYLLPSVRMKTILRFTETFGFEASAMKVAPRVVKTRCQAS